jgi:hypothetical protein
LLEIVDKRCADSKGAIVPGPSWEHWRVLRIAHSMFIASWPVTAPMLIAIGLALLASRRSQPQAWLESALWSAFQLGIPAAVLALAALLEAISSAGVRVGGEWLMSVFLGGPLLASIAIAFELIRRGLSDRWVVITIAALCMFATFVAAGDILFHVG